MKRPSNKFFHYLNVVYWQSTCVLHRAGYNSMAKCLKARSCSVHWHCFYTYWWRSDWLFNSQVCRRHNVISRNNSWSWVHRHEFAFTMYTAHWACQFILIVESAFGIQDADFSWHSYPKNYEATALSKAVKARCCPYTMWHYYLTIIRPAS